MKYVFYFLCITLLSGCAPNSSPTVDKAQEKEAIWNAVKQYATLMQQGKYAEALHSMFPSEYIVVNAKGYQTTYADTVAKRSMQYLQAYQVRYETFEPLPDPIIEISEAGDMAYAIAQIKMEIVSVDTAGNEQREERLPTFFAALKKKNGKWEIAVSSQYRE
ncbi:MAG: hypothetical protein ACPGJS_05640 [Flammeovirgaceae bacterium]